MKTGIPISKRKNKKYRNRFSKVKLHNHKTPLQPTSDDGTYLRGTQMTDSKGIVRFTSIYPGWYVSRTVHIHVKVHIDRKTVLTTQLFFDDTLSDTINADVSPYNEHKNRDTYNDTDKIFAKEGLVKAEYDGTKVLAAINISIAA